MKIGAVWNVFDGSEHLPASIRCISGAVDHCAAIVQDVSNWGEQDKTGQNVVEALNREGVLHQAIHFTPPYRANDWRGAYNLEREKRRLGALALLEAGCTHGIILDCDEFYHPAEFAREVEEYKTGNNHLYARFHPIYVYFKQPNWRFERPDITLVPGLFPLNKYIKFGISEGPWEKLKLVVDPTRRMTCPGVKKSAMFMHHFSYIRNDLSQKFRNSTARENLNKASVREEYENAGLGSEISYMPYGPLIEAQNLFI